MPPSTRACYWWGACAPLEFPDAVVGFTTQLPDAIGEALDHVPQLGGDEATLALVDGHAVDHRAEDLELPLAGGAVADAHRPRAFEASQVLEERFGEVRVAVDAIQDLHREVVVVGAVADPVDEVDGLLRETRAKEGGDPIRRVAEPAVPVIPIAIPARVFRDGGGRRGAQGAGRRVGQQFDHQGGAPDGVLEWPLIETLFQPRDPECARACGELGGVAAAWEFSAEGKVALAEAQRHPDLRPRLDRKSEDVARPSVDLLDCAAQGDGRGQDHLLRTA